MLGGKAEKSAFTFTMPTTPTTNKRSYEPSTPNDSDGENVDPGMISSPSKKAKTFSFEVPAKPFNFTLKPNAASARSFATPKKAMSTSVRTPFTAPAGRSPPRKTAGVFKNRRTSAPFSRIDPPTSLHSESGLPFSLDAAINDIVPSTATPNSMPKSWLFEIHEDTPDEAAANMVEHHTMYLDLSSDDEDKVRERTDRGKENVAPEGYDAATASSALHNHVSGAATLGSSSTIASIVASKKSRNIVRKKKLVADAMDDGERSPLSDLETEPFFPPGLDASSRVLVDALPEKSTSSSCFPISELFTTPADALAPAPVAEATSTDADEAVAPAAVAIESTSEPEIVVFEDPIA
jgi:hypothetical protein